MNYIKDPTIKSLFLLMGVFIFGYSSIVAIHLYFTNIISEFDEKIKNEQSRYKIGKYILDEIDFIESNFYKMSLMFNVNGTIPIKEDIKTSVENIKKAIDILENGGTLNNFIKLNLVGLEKINEDITFKPNKDLKYTFEAIDLIPKLTTIDKKLSQIDDIISKKEKIIKLDSTEDKNKIQFEIQMFFKQIPPMFLRMHENASRLLYESKRNANSINNTITSKKQFYYTLEFLLTLTILILVISLGYAISKKIQINNKKLKQVTDEAKNSAIEASNANKVKSQFLANMSHEIRTPLNAIIGFAEILSSSNLGTKQKEQSSIIVSSAKSLLNIINDILDISKVESGKFELVNETFNIRELLDQIVTLFSVNASQKKIRLIYNYDMNIPKIVNGDSIRLKQVLSNLLSNAIKFTPENKHVTLNVNLIMKDNESAQIHFSVKDEGIGISKEQQTLIFQPFSQADNSISRAFGGTGLGLAISSKIIDMMESEIKLKSKLGSGSDFYFELNFKTEKSEEKSKKLGYNFAITNSIESDYENNGINLYHYLDELGQVYKIDTFMNTLDEKISIIFYFGEKDLLDKVKEIKSKHGSSVVFVGDKNKIKDDELILNQCNHFIDVPLYGSKIFNIISKICKIENSINTDSSPNETFTGHVLIAEDNENNQKLIEILLEKTGLTFDIVNNGQEAVNSYMKHNYDLILMDINMPIMDGLTALNIIKNSEKFKQLKTPIIALTANTIKGDKEKYLKSGMDNYLSKPIETNELFSILNQYLKNIKPTKKNEPKIFEAIEDKVAYKKEHTIKQLNLPEPIVDKLLNKFLENLDNDIQKIKNAIDSKDNKAIYDASHYLKGPSANFAMTYAVSLLVDFERISKENLDEKFKFEELKNYFEEVKKELN